MSKFFDFCDKHCVVLRYVLIFIVFICLFFPVYKGHSKDPITAPYFVGFFYDSRFVGQMSFDSPFKNWMTQNYLLDLFGSLFLAIGIALIVVNVALGLTIHLY